MRMSIFAIAAAFVALAGPAQAGLEVTPNWSLICKMTQERVAYAHPGDDEVRLHLMTWRRQAAAACRIADAAVELDRHQEEYNWWAEFALSEQSGVFHGLVDEYVDPDALILAMDAADYAADTVLFAQFDQAHKQLVELTAAVRVGSDTLRVFIEDPSAENYDAAMVAQGDIASANTAFMKAARRLK